MITRLYQERWCEIEFPNSLKKKYAISNKGRLASFTGSVFKDGILLKGSLQENYKIMRYRVHSRKKILHEFVFFHTLVANCFCKQKTPLHIRIIFKDYNRKNLSASNLQWCTVQEQYQHSINSPKYLKSIGERSRPLKGRVLDIEKVKKIKAGLLKGKSLKELAKKFNVSDMQIHRIKTGENWKHVKL